MNMVFNDVGTGLRWFLCLEDGGTKIRRLESTHCHDLSLPEDKARTT